MNNLTNLTNKDQKLNHLDYLENVEGLEALAFAKKQNEFSNNRLKTDKRYQPTYDEIFKIVAAKDKLPSINILNDEVYNFWQDDVNIKGLLRKTSLKSFNSGKPKWISVLDIDLLAKTENENWVYKGINCLTPDYKICLISLSRGGKDALVVREFDLKQKKFVQNGFYLPESKSHAAWIDENTLLVGDGSDPTQLTTSGYPMQIKILKRHEDIQSAKSIFKGESNSVSVYVYTQLIENKRHAFVIHSVSFYSSDTFYLDLSSFKLTPLPIPKTAEVEGVYKDQILFSTREIFKGYPSGSLLSIALDELTLPTQKIHLVFKPNATQFYEGVAISKNHLWVA